METYKIIRFYEDSNKESKTIATGLTLEEAKKHCSDERTHSKSRWFKSGWFDGYTKEVN
jgi:hypothetical protein